MPWATRVECCRVFVPIDKDKNGEPRKKPFLVVPIIRVHLSNDDLPQAFYYAIAYRRGILSFSDSRTRPVNQRLKIGDISLHEIVPITQIRLAGKVRPMTVPEWFDELCRIIGKKKALGVVWELWTTLMDNAALPRHTVDAGCSPTPPAAPSPQGRARGGLRLGFEPRQCGEV